MSWRALSAEEIERLANSCVQIEPFLTLGYRAQTLIAYLSREDPGLEKLTLLQENVPAGLLCRRASWLRGPLIELLMVLPSHQGRGIGGAAIARCQNEAERNLWVTVSDFHHPARRFYARHGFVELCAIDGLISPEHAEMLLRWRRSSDPTAQ